MIRARDSDNGIHYRKCPLHVGKKKTPESVSHHDTRYEVNHKIAGPLIDETVSVMAYLLNRRSSHVPSIRTVTFPQVRQHFNQMQQLIRKQEALM